MLPLQHKCPVGGSDRIGGRWRADDAKEAVEQDSGSAMTWSNGQRCILGVVDTNYAVLAKRVISMYTVNSLSQDTL